MEEESLTEEEDKPVLFKAHSTVLQKESMLGEKATTKHASLESEEATASSSPNKVLNHPPGRNLRKAISLPQFFSQSNPSVGGEALKSYFASRERTGVDLSEDNRKKWFISYQQTGLLYEPGQYCDTITPPFPPARYDKKKRDSGVVAVGKPLNVVHNTHVDLNYAWTGSQDPKEIFVFKEQLGRGAFATVYKAIHRESGFELAIKVVPIKNEMKTALQREIEVLRKCKCPNVLSYYGSVTNEDSVWILMDYCAVGSVKDLMKCTLETLDEPQISQITKEVLTGLCYLHSINILHLDVKTGNILLTAEGKVKLADFGVSEQIQRGSRMITPADFIGSPLFMAPEVIKKTEFNHKADIWSVGITLIEMAEGRPPYHDIKSMKEIIELPARPPPTLQQPRIWSHTFNDFLSKCLVKNPTDRPDTGVLLHHPFVQETEGYEVLAILIRDTLKVRKDCAKKVMEAKELIIQIKEGRHLPSKDSETFCTISLNDQQFKTSIHKKSSNPNWGEEFKFSLVGATESTIEIFCSSKGFTSSAYIGQIKIPINQIIRYTDKDSWFPLLSVESTPKKVSGEISLHISLRPISNKS